MILELATNIRRNIKHMSQLLNVGEDRDSQLIDLANHIDTLAQQIEDIENPCDCDKCIDGMTLQDHLDCLEEWYEEFQENQYDQQERAQRMIKVIEQDIKEFWPSFDLEQFKLNYSEQC